VNGATAQHACRKCCSLEPSLPAILFLHCFLSLSLELHLSKVLLYTFTFLLYMPPTLVWLLYPCFIVHFSFSFVFLFVVIFWLCLVVFVVQPTLFDLSYVVLSIALAGNQWFSQSSACSSEEEVGGRAVADGERSGMMCYVAVFVLFSCVYFSTMYQ